MITQKRKTMLETYYYIFKEAIPLNKILTITPIDDSRGIYEFSKDFIFNFIP